MINKLIFTGIIGLLSFGMCQAQEKQKNDLYILFKTDSANGAYKSKDGTNEIYHYEYVSTEKKQRYSLKLFRTIDNNYCVKNGAFFRANKLYPYSGLEKIQGLLADSWDAKTVSFKRVFVVEQLDADQYKISEVTLYYPFDSNGVRVINLN